MLTLPRSATSMLALLLLAVWSLLARSGRGQSGEPGGPGQPGTNAARFEFSIRPTNNAVLITATTNTISITISNWGAFTNIDIRGLVGTNVIRFNDAGTPPDDTPEDGVFRGRLVTPLIQERTPLLLALTLIGTDLASLTNEPPAEIPLTNTLRTNITYIVAPRPPNDNFTNAFKVANAGGVNVGTNEFASLEPREPTHANVGSRDASIWWNWAAPADGGVLVDLAGTDFPAILAVYRGDRVSNLVAVASSTNDVARRLPPNVVFDATRGTTYRIAVSSLESNKVGNVRLRVAPGGTPDTRPPVISILSPAPDSLLSDALVLVSGSAREAFPLDSGVSNVVLQVNNGPRTNAIGAESWSATLNLPPGTNVIRAFAVDYAGNISAEDSVVVRYLNPTNDYFALSAQLDASGGFATANNAQASREPGEPLHAGNEGGRSVWYWWRAPIDGILDLNTAGSTFDTLLAVYQGGALSDLVELVSNDDAPGAVGWSQVSLAVGSNTVYRIVVDAYGGAVGDFGLQYVFTPAQGGTFFNVVVDRANGGTVSPPGGAYPSGARAIFTAVPQDDFAFAGWSGDYASAENPLEVIVSRNLRLIPRFRTVRYTDDFETGGLSRIPWNSPAPAWLVQTNQVAGGLFAARSAPIGGQQSSSLTLSTNTGAGSASFDVRVSSEQNWDFLSFLIDGTVVKRWSGEVEWQPFTFNLTAGFHTFTWRYSKDPSFESGLDAAFIDNLYLPPPASTGGGTQRPELGIRLFSEGAQLTLQGQPGVSYEIQTAPGVGGPWTTVATQSSPSGIINYLDLQAVGESRRFYRAKVK